MEQKPIIHSTSKSNYTKNNEPRVIVTLSVDKINTIIQKTGISITLSNKYSAHLTLINKKVEIHDGHNYTIFMYIIYVQFKDKNKDKAFKLECEFSLLIGSISVDDYIADLEAKDAMFEIFAYMEVDPYYCSYNNF